MKRLLCIFAVFLSVASAQTESSLGGLVTDPSGAAVTSAAVAVTELRTGSVRRVETNGLGAYLAIGLAPGTYQIQIEAPGFRTSERRGLELGAGRSLQVNVELELGRLTDSVVVEGAAPLVSVSSGDWGSTVGTDRLDNLPLNGRDIFALAARQPGVAVPTSQQRTQQYGAATHMSVDGARPTQNGYRIDGVYANDASGSAPASASGQTLGIEALQELRLASPFLAEYGRTAGGHFVAVSKSGTNEFHGSLFDFLRNSFTDARNFFDLPTRPIPALSRNQFGGLLSGPVAHNRFFFLLDYEGVQGVSAVTSIATTIGAAARTGLLPSGQVKVSPAAAPFVNLYPLPNGTLFADGTGQFITPLNTHAHENYITGKADYIRSERLRFSARYTFDLGASVKPDPFLLWDFASYSQYHFLQLGGQYVPSSSTVHEFRAGFGRVENGGNATQTSAIPSGLSFVPGQGLGSMAVAGLTDLGGQTVRSLPQSYVTNNFQENWEVSHTTGRHAIKAGAGLERLQFNPTSANDLRGFYQFTSLATLIAGSPSSGQVLVPGSPLERGWRQSLFYLFIQDEVHVTRRLSASIGLRYEPYTTPYEVNGLEAAVPDPLHDTAPTLGKGIFRNPSKANFGPRLAVAWDIFGDGRTVLRAGAGIFYEILSTRDLAFTGSNMPPFFNRQTVMNPSFPNLTAVLGAGGPPVVEGMQYYENQPYAIQLQAALEREIGRNILLRAAYAGNRGVHLPGYVGDINVAAPSYLPNGQIYFSPTAPLLNPNFQRIGMRLTQFPSAANALQLHASQRLAHGFRWQASYTWSKVIDESSNPNKLEMLNDDFMAFPLNFRANRGPASFDLRQVFSADWSWQTRRFLGGWQFDSIIQAQSGPEFSPQIGFDRAGLRSTLSPDPERPNYVPGIPVITGDPAQWFNPLAFALPAAGTYGNLGRNVFRGPGLVNVDASVHKVLWRRENKLVTLRTEIFNIANHPNFQIPSSLATFSSTGARIASAGQITQTTTTARQIQLALKVTF